LKMRRHKDEYRFFHEGVIWKRNNCIEVDS
jgi:hypothetical protein